jgi:hypothetical protein
MSPLTGFLSLFFYILFILLRIHFLEHKVVEISRNLAVKYCLLCCSSSSRLFESRVCKNFKFFVTIKKLNLSISANKFQHSVKQKARLPISQCTIKIDRKRSKIYCQYRKCKISQTFLICFNLHHLKLSGIGLIS